MCGVSTNENESSYSAIRWNLGSKMGLIRKCATINFVSWNSRTNRISIKWVNHNGRINIFVLKENYFWFRILNISPCLLTQISSGGARWMRNLILHPTSTHTAYFWRTPLPQKQEIHEKNEMMMSSFHFFMYFLFLG